MAKGYQKNKQRLEKTALLGKRLIRRCNKKCELCDTSGVSLKVMEVEPLPDTPDETHAIMLCAQCADIMETARMDANAVRFLESVIWSEIPVVQVTAYRLCRILARQGVDWAKEVLESVYLSPEVEAWLEKDGPV